MPHKEDINRAVNKLVTAQMRSLEVGGLLDQTITDRESLGEESVEDEQFLADRQSPLSSFDTEFSSPA